MSLGVLRTVLTCGLLLWSAGVHAQEAPALNLPQVNPVVVTRVLSTFVTASGESIVLPQGNVQLIVSTYAFPPGALLPEHKHLFPRYAYVLSGTLEVTNSDSGQRNIYKTGDFIIEAVEQWHHGAALGSDPVKLLVIDQIEKGTNNVVLKK